MGHGMETTTQMNSIGDIQPIVSCILRQWTELVQDSNHGASLPMSSTIESTYWHIVKAQTPGVNVLYPRNFITTKRLGTDLSSSTTRALWTLDDLSTMRKSFFRELEHPLKGINEAKISFGMLFATNTWRIEDNFLFHLDYNHSGSNRRWYGINEDGFAKLTMVFSQYPNHQVRQTDRQRERDCNTCLLSFVDFTYRTREDGHYYIYNDSSKSKDACRSFCVCLLRVLRS